MPANLRKPLEAQTDRISFEDETESASDNTKYRYEWGDLSAWQLDTQSIFQFLPTEAFIVQGSLNAPAICNVSEKHSQIDWDYFSTTNLIKLVGDNDYVPLLAEPDEKSPLEKEFNEHADRWERETGGHSSPIKRFMHEDYQTIMAMGEPVIPHILNRLKAKPNYWFWALKHFARKDAAKGMTNFNDVVKAWLDWGKDNGHIP
jgi:hypothetical protein